MLQAFGAAKLTILGPLILIGQFDRTPQVNSLHSLVGRTVPVCNAIKLSQFIAVKMSHPCLVVSFLFSEILTVWSFRRCAVSSSAAVGTEQMSTRWRSAPQLYLVVSSSSPDGVGNRRIWADYQRCLEGAPRNHGDTCRAMSMRPSSSRSGTVNWYIRLDASRTWTILQLILCWITCRPFVAAEILAENFADDREVCSRLLAATSDILMLLDDKRKRNRNREPTSADWVRQRRKGHATPSRRGLA